MKTHCVLLGALVALSASAATVKSVSVRVSDGFGGNLSDVLAQCEARAGAPFSEEVCNRDVKRLRDTKRYEEVFVERKTAGDDVEITYVVRRKFRFAGPLEVEGNEYWRDTKIAKLAGFNDGYPIDDSDIALAAERVRDAYRKAFFPLVKVDAQVVQVPGSSGAAKVRLVIDEGLRVKIRQYEFSGNDSIESKKLRKSFGRFPWWNPVGWFSEKPVTAGQISAAREEVARVYRDEGFLDVSVGEPDYVTDEDTGKTNLVFPITEGPRYTIGTVAVTGTKLFPAADVATNNVSAVTGGTAGAKRIEDAAHEVELFYGSRGYADTQVAVKQIANPKDPTTLDLEFAVTEGVPVVIDNVVIRGNDLTKTKVIQREIKLGPGRPMDEAAAERAQKRLENLRYFSLVRYYTEKVEGGESVDGSPEHRNLVYEVKDQRTGNFGIGVGASSVDSVYGMIDLQESNFDLFAPHKAFKGGGQTGRISLMAGPRIQTYEASVKEPWFMDRPLQLMLSAYRRERWYDQYDIIRTGLGADLSYPVKFLPNRKEPMGRIGFGYTLEYVQFDDVTGKLYTRQRGQDYEADGQKLFRMEEDEYDGAVESVFRIYWSDDTRDHFLIPSRGHRVTVFGDLCLGDNQWWKVGFNFAQYHTLVRKWKHVVSLRVRAETIDDLSDDLPIYDRLFLGGPRSLRGVDYREIGPRVWRGKHRHEAWGGRSLFAVTGEYTIPLFQYVRFALFTDLGSVGEDAWDPDISDNFCWSVGAGFRLDVPSFPIRLDLATPIHKPDDGVDRKVFSFNVGFDF